MSLEIVNGVHARCTMLREYQYVLHWRPQPQYAPGTEVELRSHSLRAFHSWRHTFRTRLSEAGVSDDLAKRLGGWTDDATAARYDHAERVEELRTAVEKAR